MNSRIDRTLDGSPYSLEGDSAAAIELRLAKLDERIRLLRNAGTLTIETLAHYYGRTRFEQVAESNAIEGSTLSVGETELAVLKGVTLTGHDPAYVRDAAALNAALLRLAELARDLGPTNITQLHELHVLIFGPRSGGGLFRRERVRILGSVHRPPKTWREIMVQMEDWQTWSLGNVGAPAPLRAAVSHAWIAHVHPYSDGNGRTARALSNLELVRAGFPPIIIKRTERSRYLDALAHSDQAGDLGPMLELVLDRLDGALLGLERSASKTDGYDPIAAKLLEAQKRRLQVWNRAVDLYQATLLEALHTMVSGLAGRATDKAYSDGLDLADYQDLARGRSVPHSWSLQVRVNVPGFAEVRRLAWIGYRTAEIMAAMADRPVPGPALFWSSPNQDSYPQWTLDNKRCPGLVELTIVPGSGDAWIGRRPNGDVWHGSLFEAAELTVAGFAEQIRGKTTADAD